MQLLRGFHNLSSYFSSQTGSIGKPDFERGCALTMGNFDGVHLAHQALIKELSNAAKRLNIPSVVMLFEPQPTEFFSPEKAPARLTRLRDKVKHLDGLGIDYLVCATFNHNFAAQTPFDFVKDILIDKLNVKYLLIGDDFRFGAKRAGDFAFLQSLQTEFGFEVQNTETLLLDDMRVSSTAIRQALASNDLQLAEKLLGRPYAISGRVIHGDKIGAQLGFPTANIALNRIKSPVKGVYAVKVSGKDILQLTGKPVINGIANIGNRPTVNGMKQLLEVNLFDVNLNLYGRHIDVVLTQKIRDEQKFSGLDALKNQIQLDIQHARQILSGQ